jgi:hypothetical protein
MVLDAVRVYWATANAHRGDSRGQQIREADEAIKRANAELDNTIRQLGELGLLGRPASQETLEKLTTALDHAHTVRARLGERGKSDLIGPDEIDKLPEPAKRLAAWRRLIGDTVESVTVAPATTTDGRPSRLWDPRRKRHQVPRPASIRAPPEATSRASVDILPAVRPHNSLDRRGVGQSRRLYGAHNSGSPGVTPARWARLSGPWRCDHADPGALTIAFVEPAVRCLRGSSKHRRILPPSADVDRDGCVTPEATAPSPCLLSRDSDTTPPAVRGRDEGRGSPCADFCFDGAPAPVGRVLAGH